MRDHRGWGRAELNRAATIITAGFVCGVLVVVLAIGNATLLARNELDAFLPAVVGVVLVGAGLAPLLTALMSTIRGQVTTTQEIAVVALGSVVTATALAYDGDLAAPAFLATCLVAIGLTTFLCGLGMLALGLGGLGRVIRFVPYPVFGGFLAMTGWYLFTGGLEAATGMRLDTQHLLEMVTEPVPALKVGFALAFVVAVHLLHLRFGSGALLPLAMVAGVVLFNLMAAAAGFGLAELQQLGWIVQVPPGGIDWPPVDAAALAAVDWAAVLHGLTLAPLVVFVTVAAAMMNVSGVEIATRSEIDLNRELRSMGSGNLLAGFVGGIPAYPAVSGTMIAERMGAPHPMVGVIAGVTGLAAVVFARQLLNVVPAPLLGGLLMWLGSALLIEWVVRPVRRLRRREHAIILVILGVSIVAGFPAGILTGLLAALLLFVFEYSRVDGVRFAATGRDYQSHMLPDADRALLERIGGAIVIIKLSGFIFFGTSDRIVQRISARVAADGAAGVRYVVMDFRRVTGVDSSTAMSFERLRRLAERRGIVIVLASVGTELAARLQAAGLDIAVAPFHAEPDLDSAMGWAERQLLAGHPEAAEGEQALARHLGDAALAEQLRPYCEEISVAPGERLIEQGDAADDIFFIAAGEGTVELATETGIVKLMAFGPGSVLGEIAFYRGQARTASAVARTPITAFKLTRERLAGIERDAPALAAAFHFEMARTLADRVQSANRLIRVLTD